MQAIIDIFFLLLGAAIVFFIFNSKIKAFANELDTKVEKLCSSPSLKLNENYNSNNDSSGLWSGFTSISKKLDSISVSKKEGPISVIPAAQEKEKSDDLKKRYNNLQIVNELGQRVTASLSLEETFQHLFNTINSMMDASVVELGVYFWKENRWQVLSNLNSSDTKDSNKRDYKNNMAEWSLHNMREIFLEDAEKEFGRYVFEPLILPNNKIAQSVMCFPIIRDNKERGTLTIVSFRKNAFNEYHVEMIRSLIPYTAVALENALIHQELLITQNQLVHNEKMASLGQLASGIAHEILNPLNFVKNFSELSLELMSEMGESKVESDQAELKVQLVNNLDKIHFHGDRAYGIVKSMMMLSRTGSGNTSSVDINKCIDEYIELSYQGFKIKNSEFQCKIEKKFDPNLKLKDLIQEDFGRVLLNIFNNAIYALNEKKKKVLATNNEELIAAYEPVLSIKSEVKNSKISIIVHDNGIGIPDEIKNKIFLPFFTTKPTGEGTGLGLSISHDIITKGNNGELTMRSEPGKWAEFTIELPI